MDNKQFQEGKLSTLLVQHQIGVLVFLTIILIIALSNIRYLKPLAKAGLPPVLPRVSILLPARNEESNIERCVRSLLAQDYPNYTVIVLDDESTDGTLQILSTIASEDHRIHIIRGQPLPEGWVGKNWACHQLSQCADGDFLVFTDADTRHHPHTLRDAVAAISSEKADLITAIPDEQVISWSERLTIPVIFFSMMCFLPLYLAYRLKMSILSATIGQFMMFRRSVYESIGGHAAIKHHPVDDILLGRRIKKGGFRWHLYDGHDHIQCRMYVDLRHIYQGLTKNLFGVFDHRVSVFLFIWIWMVVIFLGPLIVLILGVVTTHLSWISVLLSTISVAVSLLIWGISYWRFRFPLYLSLLYPLNIVIIFSIAIISMILTFMGRTSWKGRVLVRQEMRL